MLFKLNMNLQVNRVGMGEVYHQRPAPKTSLLPFNWGLWKITDLNRTAVEHLTIFLEIRFGSSPRLKSCKNGYLPILFFEKSRKMKRNPWLKNKFSPTKKSRCRWHFGFYRPTFLLPQTAHFKNQDYVKIMTKWDIAGL